MHASPGLEPLEPRLLLAGTVYVVNSLADTVAADGVVTLREAIQAANTDTAVNEAPAGSGSEVDTITFDAALFASGAATITLAGAELAITSSLSILGPGAATLTLDAAGASRVVSVSGDSAEASIDGVTMTGGATATSGGGLYVAGGSVFLTHSAVSGNSAAFSGGGVYIGGGAAALTDCAVSGNAAYSGGGIGVPGGTVTLSDCTMSGNSATYKGGGLYVIQGDVTLTGGSVSANSAQRGGAICNDDGNGNFNGTVTLEGAAVSGNTAGSGGGIYVGSGVVTMTGGAISGNHAIQDGGGTACFRTPGTFPTVTLSGVFVTGNTAGNRGGGAYLAYGFLHLTNTVLDGNSAATTGGGACVTGGDATLTSSTVSGNSAATSAGGVCVSASGGTATLNNTIVALNVAKADRDLSGPWSGEGDFIGGSPGFMRNPSAGADRAWGTADDDLGDLQLKVNSRCVNQGQDALAVDAAGDPLTTDMGGDVRVFGPAVDIGAYEYQTWRFVLAGNRRSLRVTDSGGTPVTITYQGPGSATVVRLPSGAGPADGAWGDIQTITVDGSDARSSLTVSATGRSGAGVTNIGQVSVHGPINKVSAGKATLTGELTIDGGASALTLGDILGGAVSIGSQPGGQGTAAVKVSLGRAHDASVTSATPIRSLTALEWLNTDAQADVISSPWIATVTIRGDRRAPAPIAGDFAADLNVTGANDRGVSLGSFRAAGAVPGGTWTLAGGAGSITMGSSSPLWQATFGSPGAWADVESITTTVGNLSGQITAGSIGRVKTKGVRDAVITLHSGV